MKKAGGNSANGGVSTIFKKSYAKDGLRVRLAYNLPQYNVFFRFWTLLASMKKRWGILYPAFPIHCWFAPRRVEAPGAEAYPPTAAYGCVQLAPQGFTLCLSASHS